jgi:hypothetical protein
MLSVTRWIEFYGFPSFPRQKGEENGAQELDWLNLLYQLDSCIDDGLHDAAI